MNPFNKILESTAIDSSSISGYTLDDSSYQDHSEDKKMKEIHELIDRLKQLVGDFDTSTILNGVMSPTSQSTYLNHASSLDSNLDGADSNTLTPHTNDHDKILNHYPTMKKLKELKATTGHDPPSNLFFQADSTMAMSMSLPHTHRFSSTDTSTVYERYSRYSLGVNRFSSTASKISTGTLSYINKDKLLNSSTRTPSKASNTLSYRSTNYNNMRPFYGSESTFASVSSEIEKVDASQPTTEIPIFEEFCEIGIATSILHGTEQLRVSSLQPTAITSLHSDRSAPIIHNLNEYCFPAGARLQYCSQKELSDLESAVASLRYQIMQFTDESNSTYYATCIISTEPLYNVRQDLIRNLDGLMEFVAAINIIKRYIRYYVYKKKRVLERRLNLMWNSNIDQVRRGGGSYESAPNDPSKTDQSKGEKFHILRAFKKAIGKSFTHSRYKKSRFRSSSSAVGTADFSAKSLNKGDPLNRSVITVEDIDLDPMDCHNYSVNNSVDYHSYLTPNSKTTTRRTLGTEDIKHNIADLVDAIKLRANSTTNDDSNMHSATSMLSKKAAVLTEKAYCILSTKPMHVLYFQILEAIVLKEKSQAFLLQKLSTPIYSGRSTYEDHHQLESPVARNSLHRTNYLKYVQYCDCSALTATINSNNNKSQQQHLNYNAALKIDLSMPEYIKSFKVSVNMLSLKEWTSALLLALLPPEIVVRVLCILLQEQSLLVYSSDAGLVTAITTAFMLLLQPFTWEGIFVPLLPMAAYEALDAPVPYIIGIVSNSKPKVDIALCAAVLSIDDFLYHHEHYIPTGYDDVNYTKNELQRQRRRSSHDQVEDVLAATFHAQLVFYENPRVLPNNLQSSCGMPLLEPMLSSAFPDLRRFISYHRANIAQSVKKKSRSHPHLPTTMIRSVIYDLSRGSIRSLRLVLERISGFNSALCGNILTQPAGWLQYGQTSREGHFEFTPKSFMKPYEAQLRFQENVINTQLFVSFMDQLSVDHCSKEGQRRFIAEWIYYRMLRRATRHSKRSWI